MYPPPVLEGALLRAVCRRGLVTITALGIFHDVYHIDLTGVGVDCHADAFYVPQHPHINPGGLALPIYSFYRAYDLAVGHTGLFLLPFDLDPSTGSIRT